MSFETREKDLLARIGRLKTKSGVVETPLLFPVINAVIQPIPPRRIQTDFGFQALITNAYILKKRYQNQPAQQGLHKFLAYDGVVMTDSGAYQILAYGDVDVSPEEIVQYQEQIGSDIATILDIPTGWHVTEQNAHQTVDATLKRAKQFFKQRIRDDILWVGPVQGGRYLNLVAGSARKMGKLPFQIHALGSPTEVMERYRFDVLVDMIVTAKMNLPIDRPLHLFGAGHPFMLALAVALGCDLFDSAAYALYAKENRYMTETGTFRLDEMEYFPCICSKCAVSSPERVRELPIKEKELFLTEHNLYVCSAEMKRIKQAIKDGRLWEHMEMRAHAHPALYTAVKRLTKYKHYIEKHSPSTKPSGLFFFNSLSLIRPEVTRHQRLLAERYIPPRQARTLLLSPQTATKPFHKSHEYRQIRERLKKGKARTHICFYVAPFGVVPIELDEIYPLSQHETAMPLDKETIDYVTDQVTEYIKRTDYQSVILLNDPDNWNQAILRACGNACRKNNIKFETVNVREHIQQNQNDQPKCGKPKTEPVHTKRR